MRPLDGLEIHEGGSSPLKRQEVPEQRISFRWNRVALEGTGGYENEPLSAPPLR
jgi:hypothetical protein